MSNNQSGRTYDEEENLPLSRYFNENYFAKQQLFSQAAQISAIHSLKPSRILELGKGNGFVSDFLEKAGYDVTTFDINERLNPDVVGNVLHLREHFQPDSFDLISCSEVLEHMPFEYFETVLSQMQQITHRHVFLTLPRSGRTLLSLSSILKVPRFMPWDFSVWLRWPSTRILKEHHWEIDHADYSAKKNIKRILEKYFILRRFSSEPINPYHQHVILEKRDR